MRPLLRQVLSVMLVTALGSSAAQSVSSSGPYELLGCHRNATGVDCELTYTLSAQAAQSFYFGTELVQAFSSDGQSLTALSVALGGRAFAQNGSLDVVQGVPVKVVLRFAPLAPPSSLRVLVVARQRFDAVPITGPAPAAPLNTAIPAGFTLSLTDCVLKGDSFYCAARLTPVH